MKEKHSREEYPSAEEKELHVVRNHKDTVFRLLYQNREKLLELYNALNGTAYEDTGVVEICTAGKRYLYGGKERCFLPV